MRTGILLLSIIVSGCTTTNHKQSSNELSGEYIEQYVRYLETRDRSDLKQSQRTFNKFKTQKAVEVYQLRKK